MAEAESEVKQPTTWPEADEHGLVSLGGALFDRGAVALLKTEYTPDEIVAGLAAEDVHSWVRTINRTHVERHGIGRLVIAGSSARPVVSGHRFTGWERPGRGMR
jgi:hypothetical protein